MGLGRAISYLFDDRHWFGRLAMVALLSFTSLVPILGLVALAALLGYLLEIIASPRPPLPLWNQFEQLIGDGASLLGAIFVYNLPTLLLAGCALTAPNIFGENVILSGSVAVLTLCCLVPLLVAYCVVAWSMLAAGTVHFARDRRSRVLYQFTLRFGDVRNNFNLTVQWVLLATLLNIVLALMAATVILSVVVLAVGLPLHAHLLGQYGQRLRLAPLPPSAAPPRPSASRPR